jgi:hypothetical protein
MSYRHLLLVLSLTPNLPGTNQHALVSLMNIIYIMHQPVCTVWKHPVKHVGTDWQRCGQHNASVESDASKRGLAYRSMPRPQVVCVPGLPHILCRGSRVEFHFHLQSGRPYAGGKSTNGIKALQPIASPEPKALSYETAVAVAVPQFGAGLGLPLDMDISKIEVDDEGEPVGYTLHFLDVEDATLSSPLFLAVQQLLQHMAASASIDQPQQRRRLHPAGGKKKSRGSMETSQASLQPADLPQMQSQGDGNNHAGQQPGLGTAQSQQDHSGSSFTRQPCVSQPVPVMRSQVSDASTCSQGPGLPSQRSTQQTIEQCCLRAASAFTSTLQQPAVPREQVEAPAAAPGGVGQHTAVFGGYASQAAVPSGQNTSRAVPVPGSQPGLCSGL